MAQETMNRLEALEALGLSSDATNKEIRDTYRGLVAKLHPDMNGGLHPSNVRDLVKIMQAHAVLKNGSPDPLILNDVFMMGPTSVGDFLKQLQRTAHAVSGLADPETLPSSLRQLGEVWRDNAGLMGEIAGVMCDGQAAIADAFLANIAGRDR